MLLISTPITWLTLAPTYRRTALIGGTLALLPCGCQRPLLADTTAWKYGETEGPHTWGGLCATGNRQSPIDLPSPGESISHMEDNAGHEQLEIELCADTTCSCSQILSARWKRDQAVLKLLHLGRALGCQYWARQHPGGS